MHIGLFDYPLPRSLIAQFPAPERTASRLLVVPPRDAAPEVIRFADIGRLLGPGDLLVVNDTRVVAARLAARKPTGGRVEIMLERILGGGPDEPAKALVHLRANKPIRDGQKLLAGGAQWVVTGRRDGLFVIECRDLDNGVMPLFQARGAPPLPPYIERAADADDAARYQTVYARADGAVAAPTAGLHFDRALIKRLTGAGVQWAAVTLHIGAGTFQPVRAESLAAHRMHKEWVEVSGPACERINRVKARGGRVIAVGTTVVRALESAARAGSGPGALAAFCGDTGLFIRPGYRFRVVDALVTNFHLPKSTLLVLVCAFAGHAKIMRAYREAVERKLRFYSYGDAMFVERQGAGVNAQVNGGGR